MAFVSPVYGFGSRSVPPQDNPRHPEPPKMRPWTHTTRYDGHVRQCVPESHRSPQSGGDSVIRGLRRDAQINADCSSREDIGPGDYRRARRSDARRGKESRRRAKSK